MATTIKLPYYAVDLPCQLPTEAEIDEASNIAEQYGGRRIVAIEPHFVVKFGEGVDLLEGENMIFVRENTSIRVPQVYALYTSTNTGKKYVVMERIAGQSLLSSWSRLGLSEKESVISTLRQYFTELRQLPPPSYYGSLDKRPLLDGIFWTGEPDPAINGPFTSTSSKRWPKSISTTLGLQSERTFFAIVSHVSCVISAQHLLMGTFKGKI